MNTLKLRIVTSDSELIRELLKDKVNKRSGKIDMFSDCDMVPLQKYEPTYAMVETPQVLGFAVNIMADVAVGLFVNWLYDLLKKKKVQRAEVNGKEVETDSRDKIEEMIKIEITIRHESNRKSS